LKAVSVYLHIVTPGQKPLQYPLVSPVLEIDALSSEKQSATKTIALENFSTKTLTYWRKTVKNSSAVALQRFSCPPVITDIFIFLLNWPSQKTAFSAFMYRIRHFHELLLSTKHYFLYVDIKGMPV
jgi:hypothetical protein